MAQLRTKYDVLEYLVQNGIPTPKVYGEVKLNGINELPESLMIRSSFLGEVDGLEGIFESFQLRTEYVRIALRRNIPTRN